MIVGAGLAGSLLAWRLLQAGERVRLVGCQQLPNASRAAAGVINPVTGRWMTKSWRFETAYPEALATYRALEGQLGTTLFRPLSVRRFCLNAEDAKRARRRSRNPRYSDVIEAFTEPSEASLGLRDTHGSLRIRPAGWVDLPRLLDSLWQHFRDCGVAEDAAFEYRALRRTSVGWGYRGAPIRRVVFCEGTGITHNPWFRELPVHPAKGETIALRMPEAELPPGLYHRGKWLLAYGDGRFRLGATFDASDPDPAPSSAGREALLAALRDLLTADRPFECEAQRAGHRPTTPDSRPLLGEHPTARGLFLFNGLGSKGATTAPWLSRLLTQHLLEGRPLDSAVALNRF